MIQRRKQIIQVWELIALIRNEKNIYKNDVIRFYIEHTNSSYIFFL